MSLSEQIYTAYMGMRKGGNADECRKTLRTLREQHGDAAFETAKVKAIAFDSRRNG